MLYSFKVYSELSGFFNFRYNISFIDPLLGGFVETLPSVMIFPSGRSHSGNIITSGNIPTNPPRSGSINDKYRMYTVINTVQCPLIIEPLPYMFMSYKEPATPVMFMFSGKFFSKVRNYDLQICDLK